MGVGLDAVVQFQPRHPGQLGRGGDTYADNDELDLQFRCRRSELPR